MEAFGFFNTQQEMEIEQLLAERWLRPLADRGIDYSMFYSAEVLSSVRGGLERGIIFSGALKAGVSIDSDYAAPSSPLEKKLTPVWERLFAPQKVSVEADFFRDLGGHSLLAARLVSELRQDEVLRGVSGSVMASAAERNA